MPTNPNNIETDNAGPGSPTTPPVQNTNQSDQKKGDHKPEYKIVKRLASGAEGAVFLAYKIVNGTPDPNEEVAIKSIVCRNEKDIEETKEELTFLLSLKHKYIVEHITFWEEVKESFLGSETRFYLAMEFCRDGSLENIIVNRAKDNKIIESDEILLWTSQTCEALAFLHSSRIIHRDIKSENILLQNNLKEVRLADFGFTKQFDEVLRQTVLGTLVYMAPEIFANKPYDEAVDIWALGVVILQLVLLKPQNQVPDVRVDIMKNHNYIRESLTKLKTHPKLIAMCEGCLRIDPTERPSASEIVQFIRDKHSMELKRQKTPSFRTNTQQMEEGVDSLALIRSEKGREFWEKHKFTNAVPWMDFRTAYFEVINFKRMSNVQQRGLKKIVCYDDPVTKEEYISPVTFNNSIELAGFPYNMSILEKIEKLAEAAESDSETKRDLTQPMTEEDYIKARNQYLNIIVEHDKVFVDPISQETLNVDVHCAPLKLATDEEWEMLMSNEYDMDYEDDKLLRLERLGQAKEQSQHENAIDYLVGIPGGHKYIILGAAAAGKTVLMRLLMYKAAFKAVQTSGNYLVPILIPVCNLSSFPKDMDFKLKCIRASADALNHSMVKYPDIIEHCLLTAIEQQRALLLFDGLDEAATIEEKRSVQYNICKIKTAKNGNGVIITSRVSGFESDKEGRTLFDDFALARVQPLTLEIQTQIASKRGITNPKFFDLLKGKYSELAKTPLLLSLMISQFRNNGTLPEVRSELYFQAIQTMINIYIEKTRSHFKVAEKKKVVEDVLRFLPFLACKLHTMRKRDFLSEEVTGSEFIEEFWNNSLKPDIDEGKFSLIIRLNEYYRFSHLSFQEYFVAQTWADPKQESDVRQYERNWLGLNKTLEYAHDRIKQLIIDPWYRETFLLCAGAMQKDDFTKFANFLLKLYRRQGHMIDSIVYNMVRERADSEQKSHAEIIKTLNNEKKLKTILDGLTHASEDLREMALSRVKLYKDFQKIAKHLIKHFTDDNNYAAEALSLIIPSGDVDTIARLVAEVGSKDAKIRLKVAFCLGNVAETGDTNVIDALLKLVDDKDRNVYETSCKALCKVARKGDTKVVDKLLENLGDVERRPIVSDAIGLIAENANEKAINALTKVSKSCEEACLALGRVAKKGDEAVLATILECVQENSFEDEKVIESLKTAIDTKAPFAATVQEKLLSLLGSTKRKIGLRAADALGAVFEKGDDTIIDKLIKLAEEKGFKERAIRALGASANKGDERVIKIIINYLNDPVVVVRVQALAALGKIAKKGEKEVIQAICSRLGDREEVLNAVADALYDLSDKDNQDILNAFLELTRHTDPGVVEQSITILGKVTSRGNTQIISSLIKILLTGSNTEAVRASAADSIGLVAQNDDDKVLETLKDCVLSNEWETKIKVKCIQAIAKIISNRKNEKITDTLFEFLSKIPDSQEEIRDQLISTLASICDIGKMINSLNNKVYKNMKATVFSIIIKAIRLIRDNDPNWKLDQGNVEILQRNKSLEATFIFLENAA